MVELGPAAENEMILAFLKAEVESSRFHERVEYGIAATGITRTELLDNANLLDGRQNEARFRILAWFRGYRQNSLLFSGFPGDATWRRVELRPDELPKLRFAKELSWQQMSDNTREISRLVEKLNRGELPQEDAQRILAIQRRFENGEIFPDLIAAEGDNSEIILIEGHSRASHM
jgi:hypothetical protein